MFPEALRLRCSPKSRQRWATFSCAPPTKISGSQSPRTSTNSGCRWHGCRWRHRTGAREAADGSPYTPPDERKKKGNEGMILQHLCHEMQRTKGQETRGRSAASDSVPMCTSTDWLFQRKIDVPPFLSTSSYKFANAFNRGSREGYCERQRSNLPALPAKGYEAWRLLRSLSLPRNIRNLCDRIYAHGTKGASKNRESLPLYPACPVESLQGTGPGTHERFPGT